MINFRLHPRDSAAEILARAQAAVADLEGVTVEWAEPPREATAVSSATSSSYALIAALPGAALDGLPVAPGLMLAAMRAITTRGGERLSLPADAVHHGRSWSASNERLPSPILGTIRFPFPLEQEPWSRAILIAAFCPGACPQQRSPPFQRASADG